MKNQGIYAIICDKTWRSYVGSSVNLKTREVEHFRLLKQGRHDNTQMQTDFNLYGENAFHWEILEYIEDDQILLEREDYWISFSENVYNTYRHSDIELTDKDILRFWSWVKLGKSDGCWLWTGAKSKDGYGQISFRMFGKRRRCIASRVAFAISEPEIWNKFMMVCHTCDNPSCCNPRHLFLDSGRGNARDMANKGNGRNSKLDMELAKEIRAKYLEIGKHSAKYVKK